MWSAVAAGAPQLISVVAAVVTATVPVWPAAIGWAGRAMAIWLVVATPEPVAPLPVIFMAPMMAGSRHSTGTVTAWYLPATMLPTLVPEITTRSTPIAWAGGCESPVTLTISP